MGKKLVVSFPGIRGTEIPLLYFCSKVFEDMGYERLFVQHPSNGATDVDSLLENAINTLKKFDFAEYDSIVFIGKSLGTVVSGTIKERLGIPASLVFLTPLESTLKFIRQDNDVLFVAIGSEDRHINYEKVQDLCTRENIPFYLEEGVGHRMEVENDIPRCLAVIQKVVDGLMSSLTIS